MPVEASVWRGPRGWPLRPFLLLPWLLSGLHVLSGCAAWPGPPQPVARPWDEALQACQIDAQDWSTALHPIDAGLCPRAVALGEQLDCLGRQLPVQASAQARFSAAGLLEFQACLQPLATALAAGRLGRPVEVELALRQCVLQLDHAPAAPLARLPWWQDNALVSLPPARPAPLLAQAQLPPLPGLSWPSCDDLSRLILPSALPAPVASPRPSPSFPITVPPTVLPAVRPPAISSAADT